MVNGSKPTKNRWTMPASEGNYRMLVASSYSLLFNLSV